MIDAVIKWAIRDFIAQLWNDFWSNFDISDQFFYYLDMWNLRTSFDSALFGLGIFWGFAKIVFNSILASTVLIYNWILYPLFLAGKGVFSFLQKISLSANSNYEKVLDLLNDLPDLFYQNLVYMIAFFLILLHGLLFQRALVTKMKKNNEEKKEEITSKNIGLYNDYQPIINLLTLFIKKGILSKTKMAFECLMNGLKTQMTLILIE
jgi:hypothetical protein